MYLSKSNIQKLLPKGTANQTEYELEPPAFAITNHKISWTTLKESKNARGI